MSTLTKSSTCSTTLNCLPIDSPSLAIVLAFTQCPNLNISLTGRTGPLDGCNAFNNFIPMFQPLIRFEFDRLEMLNDSDTRASHAALRAALRCDANRTTASRLLAHLPATAREATWLCRVPQRLTPTRQAPSDGNCSQNCPSMNRLICIPTLP